MELVLKILICFFAGAGAGLGTGFAGMSAAAVVGPILVAFLGIPPYEAVGIGLISDVLASAVSAYTYKKNGNLWKTARCYRFRYFRVGTWRIKL